MNLSASLLLATGLVAASTISSVHRWTDGLSSPASVTVQSDLSFAPNFGPGLRGSLPPVYFCGESVPIHEEAVARRLVSALVRNTAQNKALYRMRQRATRFFPIIEPILIRHRIPLDFKYLPLVESALTGMAVSPKGAVGYWQFMPATARELGLRIDGRVDDRTNLIKSTNAACRYLRYLHNRLGSWTLAAAAYNNGIGALLSNIRRQQQRDYYYLRLNAETGKYLYRILAFKELFSNYQAYESIIPDQMMAYLSEAQVPADAATDDEMLLPEVVIEQATKIAVSAARAEVPTNSATDELPLPNAADVFRGGIKARLTNLTGLEKGQVWTFHLTRNGMAEATEVEENDILYAVVEDIDPKTNKVYLRADKLYSMSDRQTYPLALAAVDASTGRIGIKIPDVAQVKAGWILTWKAL